MAFQRPSAGALDTRVELQNKTSAASGTDGLTNSYPVVATVWARVRALFGGRIVAGQQAEERTTHVITIRGRSDVGAWNHLEFGPAANRRLFRVVTVMDPDESGRFLEIMAEELRRGV